MFWLKGRRIVKGARGRDPRLRQSFVERGTTFTSIRKPASSSPVGSSLTKPMSKVCLMGATAMHMGELLCTIGGM